MKSSTKMVKIILDYWPTFLRKVYIQAMVIYHREEATPLEEMPGDGGTPGCLPAE